MTRFSFRQRVACPATQSIGRRSSPTMTRRSWLPPRNPRLRWWRASRFILSVPPRRGSSCERTRTKSRLRSSHSVSSQRIMTENRPAPADVDLKTLTCPWVSAYDFSHGDGAFSRGYRGLGPETEGVSHHRHESPEHPCNWAWRH